MTSLQDYLKQMEPTAALAEIAIALGELFNHQNEEERLEFLQNILGRSGETKIDSMMNHVTASRQLQAVSNPEIVELFEDWLDELEEEVMVCVRNGATTSKQLAPQLSLSLAGEDFLLAKLQRENKITL